jgi:hypothetical protein
MIDLDDDEKMIMEMFGKLDISQNKIRPNDLLPII